MAKFTQLTPGLGLIAVLAAAMLPTVAMAGEETRAEAAIAEAKGKIDAGDKAGVGQEAAHMQDDARHALMSAQDLLSHHHKAEALAAALHASELADQAMATAGHRHDEADANRRSDARMAEEHARETTNAANERAHSAEAANAMADQRASTAEANANAANQRADDASRASAAAMAEANAARNAPTTTTVATTQHDSDEAAPMHTMHHARHRVVHHRVRHTSHTHTTTTAVTTTHQ